MPQFADPRFPGPPGPSNQPPRFPGPHEQQAWMAARFPYDPASGQRLPGPADPRFTGPFPPGPPGQMPQPTSVPGPGPAPGPSYPTGKHLFCLFDFFFFCSVKLFKAVLS